MLKIHPGTDCWTFNKSCPDHFGQTGKFKIAKTFANLYLKNEKTILFACLQRLVLFNNWKNYNRGKTDNWQNGPLQINQPSGNWTDMGRCGLLIFWIFADTAHRQIGQNLHEIFIFHNLLEGSLQNKFLVKVGNLAQPTWPPPPPPRTLGFFPWIFRKFSAKKGQICHKNSDL